MKNYLGLEDRPERLPNKAMAAIRAEYKQELAELLEQKGTCVSPVYKAVQEVAIGKQSLVHCSIHWCFNATKVPSLLRVSGQGDCPMAVGRTIYTPA